jgi:Ca-activated chloride channel homolog
MLLAMQLQTPTASIVTSYRRLAARRWLRTPFVLSMAIASMWLAGMAEDRPVNITGKAFSRRPERNEPQVPSLRMDVNRVFIPVTVTDTAGRRVDGLQKQDFRILQDGVQQAVSEFFVDDAAASIGIVLDTSNSMRDKITPAKQALGAFLRLSLPGDEFSLVTVQSQPALAHAYTTDVEEIEREMSAVQPQGWTALYDGMYLGINHSKHAARDNRVLVVLSDGGDNNSRYTESEMKSLVRESDVRIFSVSILGRSPSLEKLAEESGGRAFHVHKLAELPDVAAAMSAVVHGEYVVGFSPANVTRDGKYHAVKVEVAQQAEGTRRYASWRHGYYAPIR